MVTTGELIHEHIRETPTTPMPRVSLSLPTNKQTSNTTKPLQFKHPRPVFRISPDARSVMEHLHQNPETPIPEAVQQQTAFSLSLIWTANRGREVSQAHLSKNLRKTWWDMCLSCTLPFQCRYEWEQHHSNQQKAIPMHSPGKNCYQLVLVLYPDIDLMVTVGWLPFLVSGLVQWTPDGPLCTSKWMHSITKEEYTRRQALLWFYRHPSQQLI